MKTYGSRSEYEASDYTVVGLDEIVAGVRARQEKWLREQKAELEAARNKEYAQTQTPSTPGRNESH